MAFETLTDTRIQELLKMPKRVTNPTARNVADANHDKRDYIVESAVGTERFKLFVRQNKTILEDFSCGLQWLPAGGRASFWPATTAQATNTRTSSKEPS
jgi:hypothetical protein